jgi:glycerophosphoryl diester phosphodiesterase
MKRLAVTTSFFLCIALLFLATSCKNTRMQTGSSTSPAAATSRYNPVVAHRGAWEEARLPQNSIASLREAIRLNCAGAEFDVHLTADDSLVICHDDTYAGLEIEKSKYAQLSEHLLPNGERLPTLQEYLVSGKPHNSNKLVLEVKKSVITPERTLELTRRCVDLVKALGMQDQVVYISFSYEACKKIKSLDATAPVQYLEGDKAPRELKADHIDGLDYHLSVFRKHPEWIAEARQLGLLLNAWTVNNPADLNYFLDQHFDYITTNQPGLLFRLLKERGQ